MVFQAEESRTSWLWPLIRRSPITEKKACCEMEDEGMDVDRYFDIADSMEKGLARELVSDFTQPLRKARKLWKFRVERSEDRVQHRLYCDNGEFLMYARAYPETLKVAFFLYDPLEAQSLYDPGRPAFTMTCNQAKTEWRLVQERCEGDHRYSPKLLASGTGGKQEIAIIRHSKVNVGEGINYTMDCTLPGVRTKASNPDSETSPQANELITKSPVWNEEVESLVLDFKGRRVLSSAKNFQLTTEEKPDHVVCQYGKIGPNVFGLDLKHPLSLVQAFGISMTTLYWL
eukprot:gnl/TRDRNA2_/TRDRNA2_50419_c0_seq1.p1 gnl/TRDRNA2_/TRDRNA2_50419_c0~~gnl/TRDRNA2_/TRDRNA2_50419_c0_seq1.p1  ORF type:complete len:287 (+),score=49.14 gnl/TRDRNA2_/TRDRNA2_50419_c0_seq1:47-907(+)